MRILMLFVLFSPALHAGEVYVWVGEDGREYYSDLPPKNATQFRLEKRTIPPANVDGGYPPGIVVDPDRGKVSEEEQARIAAARAQLEKQCDAAREKLALMRGPVRFRNDDGSVEYVTEAERARRATALAAEIEERCR